MVLNGLQITEHCGLNPFISSNVSNQTKLISIMDHVWTMFQRIHWKPILVFGCLERFRGVHKRRLTIKSVSIWLGDSWLRWVYFGVLLLVVRGTGRDWLCAGSGASVRPLVLTGRDRSRSCRRWWPYRGPPFISSALTASHHLTLSRPSTIEEQKNTCIQLRVGKKKRDRKNHSVNRCGMLDMAEVRCRFFHNGFRFDSHFWMTMFTLKTSIYVPSLTWMNPYFHPLPLRDQLTECQSVWMFPQDRYNSFSFIMSSLLVRNNEIKVYQMTYFTEFSQEFRRKANLFQLVVCQWSVNLVINFLMEFF